jgi:GTPase Era involved in 16S rRNA processing
VGKEYQQAEAKLQMVVNQLSEYASEDTVFELQQLQQNFKKKVADFHREGRKLNIGVIGRVKAGKSSFLNTLLFHGEEVLPKAATPKTATLTKMEYADENRVVIEFYSAEEWENITEDAKLGDKNECTKSAKELVDMAARRGITVEEILQQGQLDKTFGEYEELLQFLNDYVGENGKYTPLVRSVIIYMNREDFRDLSIVDTPGLNDPIPSRTQRTKEFIEVCDVVFFLSRAGSFLDANDWELLCKQLPNKGVRKMLLIASQCDGGLRDVLVKEQKKSFFGKEKTWRSQGRSASKATNIPDAKEIVEAALTRRIREKIEEFQRSAGCHESVLNCLRECQTPILISARAQDMSRKSPADYTDEEKADFHYWQRFLPESEMQQELAALGNFAAVETIYQGLRQEKAALLAEKEKTFIPTVYRELEDKLLLLQEQVGLRLECLLHKDLKDMEKQQADFSEQINAIRAEVAEVFGNTLEKIKQEKLEVNQELRTLSTEAGHLETRTGTELHQGTHSYYKHSFLCFKWGKTSESYSYTTSYTYLAASDALEQINVFGKKSANEIEAVFQRVVDMKAYRRLLLETVVHHMDTGAEGFDANYFRLLVQRALNSIEFPEVHIDVSAELKQIGNEFSGEIRNSTEQEKLRSVLAATVERLYASMAGKIDQVIWEFSQDMQEIEKTLCDNILVEILRDFEEIKAAMSAKDEEIAKTRAYGEVVETALKAIAGEVR